MSRTICDSSDIGLSQRALRRLSAIKANRKTGVPGDPPVLGHHHRPMLRSFWVVRATLKTKPLVAAPSAPQWFRIGRRHPPPVVKRHNAIHERRYR